MFSFFAYSCIEITNFCTHTYIRGAFIALSGALQRLTTTKLGSPTTRQGVGTPSFHLKPLVATLSLGVPFVSSQEEPNQAFFWAAFHPSSY